MGRIVTSVAISSYLEPEKSIRCDALVDTGASHLVLPRAWEDRLGNLPQSGDGDIATADQKLAPAEICRPVEIQVEGFRKISGEVLFLEMEPHDGQYEPLVGYLVLEACPAAVDMLGHRLVPVKHFEVK